MFAYCLLHLRLCYQKSQLKKSIKLNLFNFLSSYSLIYLQYDTEIVYLENNLKGRDHVQTLEAITQDINKTDQLYRQINDEVSMSEMMIERRLGCAIENGTCVFFIDYLYY